MNKTLLLIVETLSIWVIAFLGALLPTFVASYNKTALALCNSFAAGVMLSAGFVHLLAHAIASLQPWRDRFSFPVAEFVASFSLILVFYIETLFSFRVEADHHYLEHIRLDRPDNCFPTSKSYGSFDGSLPCSSDRDADKSNSTSGHNHSSFVLVDPEVTRARLLEEAHQGHGGKGNHSLHTVSGALCLLAALGFHSLIEGLGLAEAQDERFGVFLAIISHKGLAAITLGSTLLLAHVSRSEFLMIITIFSLATPVGVGVGSLISTYFQDQEITGVCTAVAAGTFIHIAAIEIIPSAFGDRHASELAKLISLTVGFLVMSALRFWA